MRCFFCNREAIAKVFTDIDGYQQQIDVCAEHLEEVKLLNFKQIFEHIITPFAKTAFFMGDMGERAMKFKSNSKSADNCQECFDLFHKFLSPLLKEIHEKNHVKRTNGPGIASLSRLRFNLEKAVKEERYEDAAKIRDQIKQIEGVNKNGR